MGGKDGSPGGGVPARELWWRIPLALGLAIAGFAYVLGLPLLVDYLVNGRSL